jgi:hypothetical protein
LFSRSMSVRKVRRWSARAEARMVNGMKAVGKRSFRGSANRRPDPLKTSPFPPALFPPQPR